MQTALAGEEQRLPVLAVTAGDERRGPAAGEAIGRRHDALDDPPPVAGDTRDRVALSSPSSLTLDDEQLAGARQQGDVAARRIAPKVRHRDRRELGVAGDALDHERGEVEASAGAPRVPAVDQHQLGSRGDRHGAKGRGSEATHGDARGRRRQDQALGRHGEHPVFGELKSSSAATSPCAIATAKSTRPSGRSRSHQRRAR